MDTPVLNFEGKVPLIILLDLLKFKPSKIKNKKDINILRDLAKKIKEISQTPENIEKIKLWLDHNSLKRTRAPILCFAETSYAEIIPYNALKTTNPYLREYEWYLRSIIMHSEDWQDDYTITSRLSVPVRFNITNAGMDETWERNNLTGSAIFKPRIKSEKDIEKFRLPELTIDLEQTNKDIEYLSTIFGDILDIEIYKGIIAQIIDTNIVAHFMRLRGLENFYLDIMDRPKWIHEVMNFLTVASLTLLKEAEERDYLGLNNKDDYIRYGSLGWTDELPQKDFNSKVRLKDIWGSSEGQDLTGVSPEIFEELFFPYQYKLIEKFGLTFYGCCEDLTKKFKIIKKIPNLRKVSISPFTNLQVAVEELGNNYILMRKVHTAPFSISNFNDALLILKKSLKKDFEILKGCNFEIVLKELSTVMNDPSRINKWIRTAKDLSFKYS